MTEVRHFSEADYKEFRSSIARTPKGRAFLREHERRARIMATDEVYRLFSELREAWAKQNQVADAQKHLDVLRHELQDMSASIAHARREIVSLRPKDGGTDRITSATNELDAIVLSTERASFEILNAAERILDLNGRLRDSNAPEQIVADIEAEIMNIFTACSFQDLTGQRTTKVVNALRYIEQRVMAMMSIWGVDGVTRTDMPPEQTDTRPDAHLLHGPALDAVDQSDIDRLLNEGMMPANGTQASRQARAIPVPPPIQGDDTDDDKSKPASAEPSEPMGQGDIDALFG